MPRMLLEPYNFRQHMEDVVINPPKDMESLSDPVRSEASKIGLYFDRFVRETIDALAGTARHVGKRYIDRQILDLTFELKNVSYAKTLKELITNHLQEKDDDFVSKSAFSKLWGEYFPSIRILPSF